MSEAKPIVSSQLKEYILSNCVHKNISDSIIEMISSFYMPYYGEFLGFVNFHEAKIGTAGVNTTQKGMNFYWDREFIEKIDRQTMKFVIIHEVYHLLFDHQKRGVGYDKKIANLAADMIINSIIHGEIIVKENLGHLVSILKDEQGNNSVVFVPKDYTGSLIFEELYQWLMDKYNKWQNENSHKMNKKYDVNIDKDGNATVKEKSEEQSDKEKGEGKEKGEQDSEEQGEGGKGKGKRQPGEGQSDGESDGESDDNEQESESGKSGSKAGKNKKPGKPGKNNNPIEDSSEEQEDPNAPQYGPHGKSYSSNKNKDTENENSVDMYPIEKFFENIEQNKGQSFDVHFDDDVSEEVKGEWVKAAMQKLKSRGLETGNIENIINKLRKQRKDYLKEIKRNMANDIFGNKKNKSITRPNRRDIPGLKGVRKYKTKINCLLDTSGSMGGDFEKVLSYIFQNDIEINMIMCDTEVKSFIVIKSKKELEKMKIQGLGGTTLTTGLQYIANDKNLNKCNTVILSDGYTDTLDFTGVKGNVLILSTGTECPTLNNNLKNVKQIIIDKNQ